MQLYRTENTEKSQPCYTDTSGAPRIPGHGCMVLNQNSWLHGSVQQHRAGQTLCRERQKTLKLSPLEGKKAERTIE